MNLCVLVGRNHVKIYNTPAIPYPFNSKSEIELLLDSNIPWERLSVEIERDDEYYPDGFFNQTSEEDWLEFCLILKRSRAIQQVLEVSLKTGGLAEGEYQNQVHDKRFAQLISSLPSNLERLELSPVISHMPVTYQAIESQFEGLKYLSLTGWYRDIHGTPEPTAEQLGDGSYGLGRDYFLALSRIIGKNKKTLQKLYTSRLDLMVDTYSEHSSSLGHLVRAIGSCPRLTSHWLEFRYYSDSDTLDYESLPTVIPLEWRFTDEEVFTMRFGQFLEQARLCFVGRHNRIETTLDKAQIARSILALVEHKDCVYWILKLRPDVVPASSGDFDNQGNKRRKNG
jgi:hypothetical protein